MLSFTPLDLHLKVVTVPSMQCSINIDHAVEFLILVGLTCLICNVGLCCKFCFYLLSVNRCVLFLEY